MKKRDLMVQTFFEKNEYGNVGLSHVRLSILDLSSLGKQPMFS